MRNKTERLTSAVTKDQQRVPGPGAYDAKITAIKDNIKGAAFGKTTRDGLANFTSKDNRQKPGPGDYDVSSQKNTKSFKIGQRINGGAKNFAPGPGNYDPNPNVIKDSVRNVKISNAQNKSSLSHSKSTN